MNKNQAYSHKTLSGQCNLHKETGSYVKNNINAISIHIWIYVNYKGSAELQLRSTNKQALPQVYAVIKTLLPIFINCLKQKFKVTAIFSPSCMSPLYVTTIETKRQESNFFCHSQPTERSCLVELSQEQLFCVCVATFACSPSVLRPVSVLKYCFWEWKKFRLGEAKKINKTLEA